MTPAKSRRVTLISSVGGTHLEGLVRELRALGVEAELLVGLSAQRWRDLVGGSRRDELTARLHTLVGFPLRALRTAVLETPGALVATTNPFTLPWLLAATRHLHQRPLIVLVYDLYPDVIESLSPPAWLQPLLKAAAHLNRYTWSRADAVVFLGHAMAERGRQRYGTPRCWTVIETGSGLRTPDAPGEPESALERFCHGRFVVSYVGRMGRVHDWRTLAEAGSRLMRDDGKPPAPAFVIAATGPGSERLREAWRDAPPDAVRFEAPLNDRACARLLARSAVSLVTLADNAGDVSLPSKLFSAMAAGSAIVAIAPPSSDLATIVSDRRCGAVVSPGDVEGLVAALETFMAGDRQLDAARAASLEGSREFDMSVLAARWRGLLDEVIAGR